MDAARNPRTGAHGQPPFQRHSAWCPADVVFVAQQAPARARACRDHRQPARVGTGIEYHRSPAGDELGPVFAQIGIWSERRLRRPIFEETPDTGLLMWWVRTTVKTDFLPAERTVIQFSFRGVSEKLSSFWLVF